MAQLPDVTNGSDIEAADINERYAEIYLRADDTDHAGHDLLNVGEIEQAAWSNVTLGAGLTHAAGANALRQRPNKDRSVWLAGKFSGTFTTGGVVATVATAPGAEAWIPATIDGGAHIFLVLVGTALYFYGTSGTYTVRVNGFYPLD